MAEAMKEEISDIVGPDFKDAASGLFSVVRVEVSRDLAHAKVFVSVLADEETRLGVMDSLQKSSGFIRGELTRRLRLRTAPRLAFYLDKSMEYGMKISQILDSIKEESSGPGRDGSRGDGPAGPQP